MKECIVFGEYYIVVKVKLYLPRLKLTMNETLIFFKIVLLAFSTLIPANFPLVKSPLI